MENFRPIKLATLFVGGALLVLPFLVLAYDDKTTHPALSQAIVELFNEEFQDLKISDEEKELVIQGSIDEDSGIRWMHHFYDPVYNRGLVLEDETFPKDPNLAIVASGAKSQWTSSKEWATNTLLQGGSTKLGAALFGGYFSSDNDFSWDRAIYEYAWGDKKLGLAALGHILHLLEDMMVPDHTRNDAHPPILDFGSPYEFWTKKFDRNSYTSRSSGKPILLTSISEYFNTMANYSNNNFFSKDTIFIKEYQGPVITFEKIENLQNGKRVMFFYANDGINDFKLVGRFPTFEWQKNQEEYFIKDPDNNILTDYWTRLSEQAVLRGAGAMKLFFDEVEKEKQTKILYNKNRSWIGKQWDKTKKAYDETNQWAENQIGAIINGIKGMIPAQFGAVTSQTAAIIEAVALPETLTPKSDDTEETEFPTRNPVSLATTIEIEPPVTQSIEVSPPTRGETSTATPTPINPLPLPQKPKNTSPQVPIMGAGSGPRAPTPPQDTVPPEPPVITNPDADNKTFATTTVTFAGTAETEAIITGNWLLNDGSATSTATTTDNTSTWLLIINALPQGTTTINFFAKDAAENKSDASTRTIFVDTIAPTISLTISECGQSLSPDSCLVATTTLSLELSTDAPDLAHYELSCATDGDNCAGFTSGTTTATSAVYTAPNDNTTYTFSAKAIDTTGNESIAATKTVEVITRPVVINEIAWTGTSAAKDEDEWIELYNAADRAIDLAGWTLRSSTDNTPFITLAGTIPAKSFFLLERTDQATISDITADQIYNGALINTGETLQLLYASTTIDKTPETDVCSGWCGGAASGLYYTMERYDPFSSGTEKENWSTWAGFLAHGANADGDPIKGTPRQRNSINYLIALERYLDKNKTLTKNSSPYLVDNSFEIKTGATLTIEPDVVIKFMGLGTSIVVTSGGKLITAGTSTAPVVFTSFKDDAYAGDTNQDGSASSPAPGDWGAIKILTDGSIIDRAIIRYGGQYDLPSTTYWANLRVENASTTVTNSVIEHSGAYGIFLKNATSTIESNTIRENTVHGNIDSTGIISQSGGSKIQNNTVSKNTYGLRILSGDTATVRNNSFIQNAEFPIEVTSAAPSFSSNTATGNGANGIRFEGALTKNYALAPDLPYVLTGSLEILAGKTLTISAGTIIKIDGGSIIASGKLLAEGTAGNKVVFTSFRDDDCGDEVPDEVCGDTNATTTAPKLGDWHTLLFTEGAASSTLTHAVIRYGGGTSNAVPGAIRISNTSIEIKNTVIEKNNFAGVFMQNSTSTRITDSIIRDHIDETPEILRGLILLSSSTLTIANTTFSNNEETILKDGTSFCIDGGGNSGVDCD